MSGPRPAATGLAASDLEGTWRLASWETLGDEGDRRAPFGHDPLGLVVYTGGGRMITTISRPDRAPTGGDLVGAPDAARLAAYATFVAYSGTFRVEGGDVIHSVEMSSLPDWVGTEQRRHVDLADGGTTLVLSTEPLELADGRRCHRLTWTRVEG